MKHGISGMKYGGKYGYCLACNTQITLCGIPFTLNVKCHNCGTVNVYEDSQQPLRVIPDNLNRVNRKTE